METSNVRKAALAEQLDLQGESFTSWLEHQIDEFVPAASGTGGPRSPTCVSDLLATSDVIKTLRSIDWAFTDEDTRYLTHDLHPYPAKFPPQIPAKLISALSLPGDVVMDPFGGSGTTAVEAVRLRRRAISFDANPLSALVGRVKTLAIGEHDLAPLEELRNAVDSYRANGEGRGSNWSEGLIAKHSCHVPAIPNIEKWFCSAAIGELALLRHLIGQTTSESSEDVALLAFSRIVTRVSNQDSETRYVSKEKELPTTFVLRAYLESLRTVLKRLEAAAPTLAGPVANFVEGDARTDIGKAVPPSSVDLIVTSPPYPNATDYHLYHRFRLFWLGHDPRLFGGLEIGSHLKHQRNGTDFDEYREDMTRVLEGAYRALQPGRYAVFVVGDAVFKGEEFSTSEALAVAAIKVGFEVTDIIDRPIHNTKRSFTQAARRARLEQLLVLQKPNDHVSVTFAPPAYRMWEYEERLRAEELRGLGFDVKALDVGKPIAASARQPALWNARRASFSKSYSILDEDFQGTWQNILENGDSDPTKRKDPKYATHGIHPYKGKFYPQLAKSLLNASGVDLGSVVLDPYCGSGTVPLEGFLNGHRAYGVDMNPLAAKIARAKTGILQVDRSLVEGAIASVLAAVDRQTQYQHSRDEFPAGSLAELESWFPPKVLDKLNWLLGQIRLFGEPRLVDFFEVIASSVIRDVSQQEPSDLRIRRRKEPLEDAPVVELFAARLSKQSRRLQKYWRAAARCPGQQFAPVIQEGDSRGRAFLDDMGLVDGEVDCVVTSPPYATALPYIDTDRLSILAILGVPSSERSVLEEALTGSREIRRSVKNALEIELGSTSASDSLPAPVVDTLRHIMKENKAAGVGFRRDNMPALLWRYFVDIKLTLRQISRLLKAGGKAYYVVGDSKTKLGDDWFAIETCRHISEIADSLGFVIHDPIDIDVTTERMMHMKNSITKNQVLIFERP
ncbi:DNA modification methylase [Brevundimonas alba]|uniref:DNA modification methylase n=1 Tax=Brevundimonas alba TaxID=74314 RepID=A0A7X6BNI2_9CAUL|nr:DNA methyltransferase [Brevundimonas alba]NJC40491.1 DNA modification methylase [Brevundimonas alba]